MQVKELRTQNERLEDVYEDSCAKRQAADSKLSHLRRLSEADRAANAKQVCYPCPSSQADGCPAQSSLELVCTGMQEKPVCTASSWSRLRQPWKCCI